MRTIKFRGVHPNLKQFITGLPAYGLDGEISMLHDGPDNYYDVIPETVGQYTGLKDINGKEIYVGDIVKGKTYLGNMEVFSRFIGVVKYYAPKFELDGINKYKSCREDLNSSFEIIGNIYENADHFAEVTP